MRFIRVTNARILEEQLDKIYIGNTKICVNIPKFGRNHGRVKYGHQSGDKHNKPDAFQGESTRRKFWHEGGNKKSRVGFQPSKGGDPWKQICHMLMPFRGINHVM